MDIASVVFAHDDLKIRYSASILFVVGVIEIGAMKHSGDGVADIIDVRVKMDTRKFNLHA
jgi:hypothetical protein